MQDNRQFQTSPHPLYQIDLTIPKIIIKGLSHCFHYTMINGNSTTFKIDQQIMQQIELFNLNLNSIEQQVDYLTQQFTYAKMQETEYLSMMNLPIHKHQSEIVKNKKSENSRPRQKNRGPYRSYSIDEKNYVIKLNRCGMNYASISKELEIPQKNVVRWCKEGYFGKGTGKRSNDSIMESQLLEWINKVSKSSALRPYDITKKAKQMSNSADFKASRGWFKNFMRRNDLNMNQIKIEDDS